MSIIRTASFMLLSIPAATAAQSQPHITLQVDVGLTRERSVTSFRAMIFGDRDLSRGGSPLLTCVAASCAART